MTNPLYFTEQGNGLPIVLLHGFCENKSIWDHFVPGLAKDFRVIQIDIPGFGENKSFLKTDSSISEIATQIYETLQDAQIEHFAIVGHSLGGYVALEIIKKYAESVLGLCMFNSTCYADSDEKKEVRNKTINYVQEHGVEAFIKPFVPGLFFHTNRESCAKAIEKLIQIGLDTPKESIITLTKAMRDRDNNAAVLEEINVPVLYIVGKNDSAVSLKSSVFQSAKAKYSTSVYLPFTGHMAMFEKEKESLHAIQTWAEGIIKN